MFKLLLVTICFFQTCYIHAQHAINTNIILEGPVAGPFGDLYSMLNEGKVVFGTSIIFIDSLSPGWTFYSSGVLQNFYSEYGPNSQNKIEIFCFDYYSYYESLDGPPPPGQGYDFPYVNWLAHTPFPVIAADANLGADFNIIQYAPSCVATAWTCPDRTFGQGLNYYTSEQLEEVLISGCDFANEAQNASLLPMNYDNRPNCPNQERPLKAYLSNNGTDSLKYARIGVSWGGIEQLDVEWTGGLASYQLDTVDLGNLVTDGTDNEVQIYIKRVGWQHGLDQDQSNDTLSFELVGAKSYSDTILSIDVFNGSQEGLAIDIYDNIGNELYCFGYHTAFGDFDSTCIYKYGFPWYTNTFLNVELDSLGGECLQIDVKNTNNGGLGTNTPYYVRFYEEDIDSTFWEVDYWPGLKIINSMYVDLPLVNVTREITTTSKLKLVPNPSSDETSVICYISEPTDINLLVSDVSGRLVYACFLENVLAGDFTYPIDTRQFSDGMYYVTLQTAKDIISAILVVKNE
jgi:hypothetical protein